MNGYDNEWLQRQEATASPKSDCPSDGVDSFVLNNQGVGCQNG